MSDRFQVKYWHALCLVIATIVFSELIGGLVFSMVGQSSDMRQIAAWGLSSLLSLGAAIYLGRRLFVIPAVEVFHLEPVRPSILLPALMTIFGLSALASALSNIVIAIAPGLDTLGDTFDVVNDPRNAAPAILLEGGVAPLTEETLFRGLILGALLRSGYRPWNAVLFSSFLFGFAHFNVAQFLYAGLVGLYFAYVYARTGNLAYPLILHAAINVLPTVLDLAGVKLPFVSGISEDLNNSAAINLALIVVAVATVMLGLGLLLGRRVLKHRVWQYTTAENSNA